MRGSERIWDQRYFLYSCLLTPVLVVSVALNVYQHSAWRSLAAEASPSCDACCKYDGPQRVLSSRDEFHYDSLVDVDLLAVPSRILGGDLDFVADSGNGTYNSANASSAGHASAEHGGHGHQHDAMVFLFIALLVGVAVMHFSMSFIKIQETVVLFCFGILCSLFLEGLGLKDSLGVFGVSYEMWMSIDPHLFMFTLLPALLAGDAMTIDTSVAARVVYQCLYLAGPGVIICAMGTALFLQVYLQWDFLLSLVAGSILCATDPVAVVALLKELGASPMLTVQIQGESLLNDGTAIVLYLISYDMLSGKEYDVTKIVITLVRKAMLATALGLFIGYFFFTWIRWASNRFAHQSSMIQISLTLCCAYWSFIMVEGVLGLSGILATVASSLVLARHMWPYIVSPDALHHVWHTFETLGNTIVFFLAGSLTGEMVVRTAIREWVNLFVIYIFLVLLRGGLIFASRPLLSWLSTDSQEVTVADATLMTWGGLRGAVGLAMAILVVRDRAKNEDGEYQIEKDKAELLLFYVSGVAFLTLVINAMTAPALVQRLGVTATPHARQQLLKMFHKQMVHWSEEESNPPEVTDALKEVLDAAEEKIDQQQIHHSGPRASRGQEDVDVTALQEDFDGQDSEQLIEEFRSKVARFAMYEDLNLAAELDPGNLLGNVDEMICLITNTWIDGGMAKVVNAAFLNIVNHHYLNLIKTGDLRPGSVESEILLTSVRASWGYRSDLVDYSFIHSHLKLADQADADVRAPRNSKDLGHHSYQKYFVESSAFNIFIAIVIVLNSVQVIVEELVRDDDDDGTVWLVFDALFTFIFFMEFVLKFVSLNCRYFKDVWNRFDFFLVLLGIGGFVLSVDAKGKKTNADEARTIRLVRVLRTLRFLRAFRLWQAHMNADKNMSTEIARKMKKVQTLQCFAHAHLSAENDLIKFFGGNGKIDEEHEAEIARCIVQSQISVYSALISIAKVQGRVFDKTTSQKTGPAGIHSKKTQSLADEISMMAKQKKITEGFESFVIDAHESGAITGKEAHEILHPLQHHLKHCTSTVRERADGVIDASYKLNWKKESWTRKLYRGASNMSSFITFSTEVEHKEAPLEGMTVRVDLRAASRLFDDLPEAPGMPVPEGDPPCVVGDEASRSIVTGDSSRSVADSSHSTCAVGPSPSRADWHQALTKTGLTVPPSPQRAPSSPRE